MLLAGFLAQPAAAQEDTESASQQRLQDLGDQITEGEARLETMEQDADRIRQEYAALQKQMVTLARQIQDLESDIDETQQRLDSLQQEEIVAAAALRQQAADMAETLAAMQRLSQTPASTLMAKPEDIDTMARTALLFDAILPALNEQAAQLRARIAELDTIRTAIRQDQAVLEQRQAALEGDRKEMTRLAADKNRQQQRLAKAMEAERQRVAKLAAEAQDLEDLIARLGATQQTPADRQAPLLGTMGKPIDSLPFKQAKGRLTLPASGLIIRRFNQRGADGMRSRGIRVETGALAQVTSVWDGNIVFAGPFRDYGQLLIIDHGQGYHSLLAGMARIEVDIAQWVLAGEPVGIMHANNNSGGRGGKPGLYLELRQGGQSIDPLPWLAVNQRKVKK